VAAILAVLKNATTPMFFLAINSKWNFGAFQIGNGEIVTVKLRI